VYFDWEQDILKFNSDDINDRDYFIGIGGSRTLRAFTESHSNEFDGNGDEELSEMHSKLRRMVIGGWKTDVWHLSWIENFFNSKLLVLPGTILSFILRDDAIDDCPLRKTASQRLKQEWARIAEERKAVFGDEDQGFMLARELSTDHSQPLDWTDYSDPLGNLPREDSLTEYSWPTKVVFIDDGTIEAPLGRNETLRRSHSALPTNLSSAALELMGHLATIRESEVHRTWKSSCEGEFVPLLGLDARFSAT
jgi:hypothetical protein